MLAIPKIVSLSLMLSCVLRAFVPAGIGGTSQVAAADTEGAFTEELQPVHHFAIPFEENAETEGGTRGDLSSFRFFNDLGGDYDRMGPNAGLIQWDRPGVLRAQNAINWSGVWNSLEGLARERHLGLDFARCYPDFIRASYQPKCIGFLARMKGNGHIRFELVSGDETILWTAALSVTSKDFREYRFDIPEKNRPRVKLLNWLVESGDVSLDSIDLVIRFPRLPIDERVFLKSYAKLARGYDRAEAIVKDRINWPVGDFDNIPATGLFCLATAAAADLGFVEEDFARETLRNVHATISRIPRAYGILPHFVHKYDGQYRIQNGTEYSILDMSLYVHSMLVAAQMLNEPSVARDLISLVRQIDFDRLRDEQGRISHGLYDDGETRLESVWWDWGGETALVLLLERMAAGETARLQMSSSGRVHGNIGFIAEIAGLFYSEFEKDVPDAITGQNWAQIRRELLRQQMEYFPSRLPGSKAAELGIYGLSAGEGYRGFGYAANGTQMEGITLIHPHYILLSATLHDATDRPYRILRTLEEQGLFPPWGLVENVTADLTESLPMYGSLNAAFESISAYHLLKKHRGERDEIYQATRTCEPLTDALSIFYPDDIAMLSSNDSTFHRSLGEGTDRYGIRLGRSRRHLQR